MPLNYSPRIKSIHFLLTLLLLLCFFNCTTNGTTNTPPIKAPFTGLDTLTTNDWWNRSPNKIINLKVERKNVIAFGIYTVHNNTLKLTAQLFPLYPNETREVRLAIKVNDRWLVIKKQNINDIGWATTFRIEDWNSEKDIAYRLLHGDEASFEGLIRKDPKTKNEIVLAALSCNSN